jgi:hypothetical protein
MSDSVIIRLKPGTSREEALNERTLYAFKVARPEFHEAFVEHYRTIHSCCHEGLPGPGVVVMAVGPSGFEGSAAILAKPDGINVITVGRHGYADLFLSDDPGMSLRQSAILVYPHAASGPVRFRVLDLRSGRPFEDEQGRQLEALEAEGPVFLRSGAYTLFVFPADPGGPAWSSSPETAWAGIPERRYLEEDVREPGAFGRVDDLESRFRERAAFNPADTLVLSLPGPVFDHEKLLQDGENPRGRLVVRSAEGELTLLLGRAATTRGVLLGRYERCDGSRFGILSDHAISRVHALVVEIAGQLYVMDAGSKNGIWIGPNRVRVVKLTPGLTVTLAGRIATLDWSRVH